MPLFSVVVIAINTIGSCFPLSRRSATKAAIGVVVYNNTPPKTFTQML